MHCTIQELMRDHMTRCLRKAETQIDRQTAYVTRRFRIEPHLTRIRIQLRRAFGQETLDELVERWINA